MSAAAALPIFGDAYLADTQHLTLDEHGAYFKLMLIAWRSPNCALPDDDRRIATMLGITTKRWSAIRPAVMAFWDISEHGWQQKRLLKEFRWVTEKSRQNSDAAKDRWAKSFPAGTKSFNHNSNSREAFESDKSLKTNATDDADAYANGNANGYAPPPLPIKREKEANASSSACVRAKPKIAVPIVPDWVPAEAWTGYLEMRKRIGKPLVTPRAIELAIGKLKAFADEEYPPGDVLDQSTMNGWQGLFRLKDDRNGNTARPMARGAGAQPVYRSNPALDRYRELVGDLDREAGADARTPRLHN